MRALPLTLALALPWCGAAGPGSLADLLDQARSANPRLRSAQASVRARAQVRPQVTALPDPRLQLGVQVEPVETRVGPQRGGLALHQRLPTGGKRKLRGAIADRSVEVAEEDLEGATLAVEVALKRAYYERWFVRRSREITAEMRALLTRGERVARTRYAAGRGGQDAVLKAQVELGVLEDRLRTLDELEPTHVDEILALLDRAPGGELPPPHPDDLAELEVVHDLERLHQMTDHLAPSLRALRVQAEQKSLEARLAKKGRVPDVTLGLAWTSTGEARALGTPGSGNDPLVATVAFDLPVHPGVYRAAARQAAHERDALLRAREGAANALRSRLRRAYFGWSDARRKLALYRDSLLPKARQSLDATFAAFQAGGARFLDLLDTERALLEFELAHARALADHLVAVASIEALVGAEVSRKVAP